MRTIVASRFGGFDAVRRMSWAEYNAARTLIAEERLGTRVRQVEAAEDAAFAAARSLLAKE